MSTISIRGIDPRVLETLRTQARQDGARVNTLVLRLMNQGLGLAPQKLQQRRHQDLDALVGAWSAEEAAIIETATAEFGKIDPGLWN